MDYIPLAIPVFVAVLTVLAAVFTLERIFGLLGRIPRSGWFVRHRKQWRLRETKRIEKVTAEMILRFIRQHGEVLDELGENRAIRSYNSVVTRIQTKYPQAKP